MCKKWFSWTILLNEMNMYMGVKTKHNFWKLISYKKYILFTIKQHTHQHTKMSISRTYIFECI